jgi:hypothetical protein
VTPHKVFATDPERTHAFETARDAARAAHDVASPPMVMALGYLASLSDNSLLPVELRYRAREAALRVAEAALHLDYLPEIFNVEDGDRMPDRDVSTVLQLIDHQRRDQSRSVWPR